MEAIRQSKSQNMLKYMNRHVDPCSNFYEFACGNWPNVYPAKLSNLLETNSLQNIQADVDHVMLSVVSDSNINTDTPIDKKVKAFYHSCMNLRNSEQVHKTKLKALIAEFGQMPVLVGNEWDENKFDWLKTVADIANKYDINIILGRYIRPDLVDKKKYTVNLDLPQFGLDKISMYLDQANGMFINEYFMGIAQQLGQYLDVDEAMAQVVAREILGFEMSLAMGAANESMPFTDQLLTAAELKEDYSSDVDFEKYLTIVQGNMPKGRILDKAPEYHRNLIKVLKRTPKRAVANYIYYSLIRNFLISPPPMSYEALQASCVTLTRKHFGDVVDNMVYRRTHIKDAERAVINMVYDLKAVLEFTLRTREFSWIGQRVQKKINEKLKAMKVIIKSYENNNNFVWKYGLLIVDVNDLFGNLKSIHLIRGISARSRISDRMEVYYEEETPLSFLPKYLLEHNALVIPVGFLQPFFFWSLPYPPAINLAQMGFFIAHEIIHAIDKDGAQFGKEGEMRFWFDGAYAILKERMDCFKNQYKGYIFGGAELPELQSQAENIADASGLRLAYRTYVAWEENPYRGISNRTVETLPNMPYSGKQLFFISFAQLWCSDVNSAMTNLPVVTNGENAPGSFKVMGALSHLDEFAQAFQCPNNNDDRKAKCSVY
uniref:Peptidase M13 C-terminal domain-containing protein n=1 Tax=Stomoxys calcitrans TaxID=35570 RepID=A0A1I8PRV8_STOCA